MNKLGLLPVTQLKAEYERTSFDCGSEPLNQYLKAYALQNQKRDMVRNYVCCDSKGSVKGFYSLTYGQLMPDELPLEVTKNTKASSWGVRCSKMPYFAQFKPPILVD
jgi:hypothetical protein